MRKFLWLPALLALCLSTLAHAQNWVEGTHYFRIVPPHPTDSPGQVEVAELFSYACPFCAQFNPYMDALKKSLPANVKVIYVPQSFNTSEDWPMFQRAACTAQVLGIFEKTNSAMYDAVWKTGELAVSDLQTRQLKKTMPTIEDAARYYNHISGVSVSDFLKAASSFSVDMKMRSDDALLRAFQVEGTPTLVINGKYRVTTTQNVNMEQMVQVAKYLIAKESH